MNVIRVTSLLYHRVHKVSGHNSDVDYMNMFYIACRYIFDYVPPTGQYYSAHLVTPVSSSILTSTQTRTALLNVWSRFKNWSVRNLTHQKLAQSRSFIKVVRPAKQVVIVTEYFLYFSHTWNFLTHAQVNSKAIFSLVIK